MKKVFNKNLPKFRHEYKHEINNLEKQILITRLDKLFNTDKNARSDGFYRVTSLYFDSINDIALRQKIDGVNKREKFRIRYYNDDFTFIRLEKKIKRNSLGAKFQARLSKEEVQKIISGDYDFLLDKNDGNGLYAEFYYNLKSRTLRPKTIVVYDRKAYTYEAGNTRITIDTKIRTGMRNVEDFFNTKIATLEVSNNISVLEVKYDEFLPEIVRMAVQIGGRNSQAFSKYQKSRIYE